MKALSLLVILATIFLASAGCNHGGCPCPNCSCCSCCECLKTGLCNCVDCKCEHHFPVVVE